MQFIYKSMTFDVTFNIDENLIVATYINPQKIIYTKDEHTGEIIKKIGYSDIVSFTTPISDIYIKGDEISRIFENNDFCFSTVIKKLCIKIDSQFK